MTQEEIEKLTDEQRKKRKEELYQELKLLNATPRSDWHAGFEAYLKADAHEAEGGRAEVIVEHSLGEEPPRIDFIVWLHDEEVKLNKEIYSIFRRFNVIEYKNPHDQLNWRVIHKVIGYAHLYIGLAEREGDRPKDQITISIFRAVKNPELFKELDEMGCLEPDAMKGIYHIKGLTEFPFQIVIMSELQGIEYAAARAMIDDDRASIEDIESVIVSVEEEQNEVVRNHKRVYLNLIGEKNPERIEEIRRKKDMGSKWMEIFKDEISEHDKKQLFIYVQAGGMTPEFAASQSHQTADEFIKDMKANGYKVPEKKLVTA